MRRLATAAVVALLGFAGAAQALSAHGFATRADRVCRRVDAKVGKLPRPKSAKDIGPLLKRTLRIVRPAQRDLEAIPLPHGKQRSTARRAVELSRQGLHLLEATSRRIAHGADPLKTVTAAQPEGRRVAKRERALWRRLGAHACASP